MIWDGCVVLLFVVSCDVCVGVIACGDGCFGVLSAKIVCVVVFVGVVGG